MKILVLSDVHYPLTVRDQMLDIIRQEEADRIIFLGDSIASANVAKEFLSLLRETPGNKDNISFVIGDNEIDLAPNSIPSAESYEITLDGKKFTFLHGHQFNLGSDATTAKIATILKKLDARLPVLAYAIRARIKMRKNNSGYLVLGHCHALMFFRRLKVICVGCLTTSKDVYSDRGYVVIKNNEEEKNLELLLVSLENDKGKTGYILER